MPFDGLIFASEELLQKAAFKAGLEIVDLGLLERHKAAEVKRREPGWAYRHRAMLQIAFGATIIAGSVGFLLLETQEFDIPAVALLAALCGLFAAAHVIPMRGPARWEERIVPDLDSVHPAVARAARELREELPDVQFRIGELFQQQVKLDPYLIAVHGDARLLVGIWDGEDLIFCA